MVVVGEGMEEAEVVVDERSLVHGWNVLQSADRKQ
jgi:hypothetical protein